MTIEALRAKVNRCERDIAKADIARQKARRILDMLAELYWRRGPIRHHEILADHRFSPLCAQLMRL
jgi:hypothetical protein